MLPMGPSRRFWPIPVMSDLPLTATRKRPSLIGREVPLSDIGSSEAVRLNAVATLLRCHCQKIEYIAGCCPLSRIPGHGLDQNGSARDAGLMTSVHSVCADGPIDHLEETTSWAQPSLQSCR